MSKELLTSQCAAVRLAAAGRWLHARGGGGEVLVLSPTRGAADDLLRRACGAGEGIFGVHRLAPLQLAAELATRRLAEDRRAPVSTLGVEALAARAIARCRAAGRLAYFAPVAEAPGLVRALAATLRELRAQGVALDALAATGAPGRDLAALAAAYEEELDRFALADEALVYEHAGAACADAGHVLLGLPLLLLDLSPVSAAERRFLARLAARSPRVLATAAAGDVDGRAALEEIVGVAAVALAEGEPTTRLGRLRRDVFRAEIAAPSAPLDAADESVVVMSAPGEGRECVEIVRRIRDLALAGVPFDRVAVLLRDPQTYLPLVEEAFYRARIPVYFSRGTVRPHPAGRAFLALLACAAENCSASRFAEYLSLGQVPDLDAAGAPPAVAEVAWVEPEGDQLVFKSFVPRPAVAAEELEEEDESAEEPAADGEATVRGSLATPRRWEQLLVDAAVVGGRERWERRLDGLAAELELQLRDLGNEEAAKRRQLERRRLQLAALERFALPVVEELAALPAAASWGEWLALLARLASRVLRHPEKVLTLLAELRPMDRVRPVLLDEVRRVLEERLSFLRTEPPPRRYGRVLVATVGEAWGRAFDVVFLPGLAEGIFPRRISEDPLLLDPHRRALRAAGYPLPTQQERFERERLLLRLAAGAATERLVVSYPNLDPVAGRARVPSFYALDVLRAAEGRLSDLRVLEAGAARESATLLGWPAPRRPEQAIDDAELDLAVLTELVRGGGPTTSRGRYMLEANASLRRSLRARWLRWRPRFSWADGLVEPEPATREALAGSRLGARSYSPTALQTYAACPYRFLLHAVLRLRPRDEVAPLEQLDPLTRGSLFHETQFELLGTLRDHQLLPLREERLRELFDHADQALDRVAARYREALAPAIPRVYESEIEGLRTDLRGWIRTLTTAGDAWRPAYFELSFGLPHEPGRDPASRRDPVSVLGGALLRGSIDVVERDDDRGVARVTDHKTGKAIAARRLVVGRGETLQPLLYALVAERMLGVPVESGRLFYCTRRGGYQSVEVRLDDDGRRQVETVLRAIDHAVREGFLPAAPRADACRSCDFRLVCGPMEELRLERKARDLLAGLEALRRMA